MGGLGNRMYDVLLWGEKGEESIWANSSFSGLCI